VAILDDKLGAFKGRLARDRVVEQANYLARDDRDGFEAKFGKLGSE
jgi:predicted flap endonuclease-1-like 5' DNA nuclease